MSDNTYRVDIGTAYNAEVESHVVLEHLQGNQDFLKEAIGCCNDSDGFISVQVEGYVELTLPGWETHDIEFDCSVALKHDDVKDHVAEEIDNLFEENKRLRDRLSEERAKSGAFEVELKAAVEQGFVRQSHHAIESK